MLLLSILLGSTFFFLSSIHFYWALGGRWGLESAVPTKSIGGSVFSPSVMTTVAVAIGLLVMGFLQLKHALPYSNKIDFRIFKFSEFAIALVFLIRAVGDFKYVGFFKKVNETAFAKKDLLFYSPLCLLIAIGTGWLAFHY
jgi:hypothetical protein